MYYTRWAKGIGGHRFANRTAAYELRNSLKKKTVNLQPEKFGNPKFLSPLYQLALDQFHQSAQALDPSDNLIARMKSPDRSMMVSLPIKLDIWNSTNVLWLPGPAQQRARAG